MKIGQKILLGFVGIALAVVIIGGISLNSFRDVGIISDKVTVDVIPGVLEIADLDAMVQTVHVEAMDFITSDNEDDRIKAAIQRLDTTGAAHLEHMKHHYMEEMMHAEEMYSKIENINSVITKIIALKEQGASMEVLLKIDKEELHPASAILVAQLNEHKAIHIDQLEDAAIAVARTHTAGTKIILWTSGFVFLLAIALGLSISRLISNPITKLVSLMAKAGDGDLTVRSDIMSEDEIGDLTSSFNTMLLGQHATISKVSGAADIIKESADITSSSTQQLASFAMNQSSMVQELKSAMEEVVQSVMGVSSELNDVVENINDVSLSMEKLGHTSDGISENTENVVETMAVITHSLSELNKSTELVALNANSASEEARSTVRIASEGKKTIGNTIREIEKVSNTMEGLLSAIKGLGKAATQIGDIVEVIDDIAEQTNLLSLNASIEAARAGEHGKGFAVVAEAIGKLAEKSSESTKDISQLIKVIQDEVNEAIETTIRGVEKVEANVLLVKDTGVAFDDIYSAVGKTTQMIGEIAVSTNKQSKTSNEITMAIKAVNNSTVNVASALEEQSLSIKGAIESIESIALSSSRIAGTTEEQAATSEQVLATIEDIDMMTIDEAKASEEVAKTAVELAQQAYLLSDVVNSFKIMNEEEEPWQTINMS